MKDDKKRAGREKLFSCIISFAIILTLGYGIYSAVFKDTDNTDNNENNIVNLNEPEKSDNSIKLENISNENADDVDNRMDAGKVDSEKQDPEINNKKDNDKEIADDGLKDDGMSERDMEYKENINDVDEKNITENINEDVSQTGAKALMEKVNEYSFSENTKIDRPVEGNVVMKYSNDATIFYKSLNAYKTNPAILISAPKGTAVGVVADGVISSVYDNEETGKTVKVSVGNGYEMTYGMLDEVVVRAGNTVTKGQLLGSVADPTAYYMKEGPALYFKMEKDGEPVDPDLFFEEEM